MKVNENVAELVGAIIGDGHIYRKFNKYRIGFTGDITNDRFYYDYLKELIRKEWNKEANIFVGGRGLRIVVNSKEICNFLINDLHMYYGKGKCEHVVIPEEILFNWNLAKNTIRGIVDTDGTVFVSKKPRIEKYPCIEISTVSEKLAHQIREILENKGFRVNNIRKSISKSSKLVTHRVVLNGQISLKKWLDEIGFSNPYKLKRAKSYLKDGDGGNRTPE